MKRPVAIIGVGEMAGVFARGFLRLGHPVFPVTRCMSLESAAAELPEPELVLVAVGEADLHAVLETIPDAWRNRIGLLQNELLPRDWESHNIPNPTVIAVWFEKKRGQDYKVLVPSPVFGPQAGLIKAALASLDIPAWELASNDELLFQLVRKNVYILTTNIAGMITGGTVELLWNNHRELALEIADEVMDIQDWLVNHLMDRPGLIEGMVEGILGDPAHQCMGRSAPARLARAVGFADQAGLAVPRLREILARH